MGLPVCEEGVRAGYNRDAFGSAYSSLEDEIIADLHKSGRQVYTPYTCTLFDIRADGTADTDIEHIVALAEAYDSGLAESQFRTFAGDLDNLTIADPTVNRSQKSDRDAAEWGPPQNRGWFAARVVAVKQKYALSVNPAERVALQAMLNSDASRTVTCGEPAAEVEEQDPTALDFAHFANGGLITSCVRQVLQKVFPKNSVLECRSPSGLWECGKAERFWRSFSKPQRESAPFGGFPLRRHFHQASAFLSFLVLFLSFVPSKVFHSDCSLQDAL